LDGIGISVYLIKIRKEFVENLYFTITANITNSTIIQKWKKNNLYLKNLITLIMLILV